MAEKDWIENYRPIFMTLRASNHTENERETNDYYATEPRAVELLLEQETFSKNIWEPACGEGHVSKVLEQAGHSVRSTDLVYRGYGEENPVDFLRSDTVGFDGDIITNPPYKYGVEFVDKALQTVADGHKVAMFLKVQFLEGKRRRILFDENPPKTIYVSSSRLKCAKNGQFDAMGGSAVAYAWYVWQKGWHGETVVKWIN